MCAGVGWNAREADGPRRCAGHDRHVAIFCEAEQPQANPCRTTELTISPRLQLIASNTATIGLRRHLSPGQTGTRCREVLLETVLPSQTHIGCQAERATDF